MYERMLREEYNQFLRDGRFTNYQPAPSSGISASTSNVDGHLPTISTWEIEKRLYFPDRTALRWMHERVMIQGWRLFYSYTACENRLKNECKGEVVPKVNTIFDRIDSERKMEEQRRISLVIENVERVSCSTTKFD